MSEERLAVPAGEIKREVTLETDRVFVASQWQLMWWKFRRHKAAVISGVVLIVLYTVVLFAEFFSPYLPGTRSEHLFAPPQGIHFRDPNGQWHVWPLVYGIHKERDMETLQWIYSPDRDRVYPLQFFVHGETYKLWGHLETDLHFFGVHPDTYVFLLGTDHLGRDILSRVLHAGRVSLTIVLLTVSLNLSLGLMLGGISGLYGGAVDNAIQRTIEVIQGVPSLPLWMGLAAAIPPGWAPVKQYLAISVVLSAIGWTGAARIVRSKFLSTREQDFVLAAQLYGTANWRLILIHLVPSFMSYVIVRATLDLPAAILGETSLSFLGVGLRAPALSLGVLLQQAQNIRTVAFYPWLMAPALLLVFAILAYNFLGDGLRDAADPYAR
jgi:peptide/nickel transport system permease protein